MKAADVYLLPEVRGEDWTYELWTLNDDYNFTPEFRDGIGHVAQLNKRIKIKHHMYHKFDSRRIWQLSSLWLDEKPFMIFQLAGREGRDHGYSFITDKVTYNEMIKYVLCLEIELNYSSNEADYRDIIDPEEDIKDLTDFCGDSYQSLVEFRQKEQRDKL